jgi:hypothetical protein
MHTDLYGLNFLRPRGLPAIILLFTFYYLLARQRLLFTCATALSVNSHHLRECCIISPGCTLPLHLKKHTMSKQDYEAPILPEIYYVQLEDHDYREGPELEYIAYV